MYMLRGIRRKLTKNKCRAIVVQSKACFAYLSLLSPAYYEVLKLYWSTNHNEEILGYILLAFLCIVSPFVKKIFLKYYMAEVMLIALR